jgi:hypothetical protein
MSSFLVIESCTTKPPNKACHLARFGIGIRSRKLWEDSLAAIGQKIER